MRRSGADELRTHDAPLEEEECVGIADIQFGLKYVHRRWWVFRCATVNEDKEGAFAAQVVEQQVEETINDKGLEHN